MFVDVATVKVKAGDGGDGAVSFRHEKFVDRGGPDGGDGGDGGNVIFEASRNQNTLANFRHHKELKADSGKAGAKRRQHGRSGQALNIAVPVGTAISNEAGELLADLAEDGQTAVIAQGGKGGFGNAHFVSSTRQAPKVAEKGEAGEELTLILELKMIADVGLIGLPNAGKSTLLSVISNARPEIADYAFTTLTPNLGVVDVGKTSSLLMADIPGLIEGASHGKGLGDEFLRHVERTKVLLHLIDSYQDDLATAYKTVQAELKNYRVDLSKRPQVVVLTKIDGLDDEIVEARLSEIRKHLPKTTPLYAISAKSGQGLKALLRESVKLIEASSKTRKTWRLPQIPVLSLGNETAWEVQKTDKAFVITGKKIERFAKRTDFNDYHALRRLRDIMKKMGIAHELTRQQAEAGDLIVIGKPEIGKLEF